MTPTESYLSVAREKLREAAHFYSQSFLSLDLSCEEVAECAMSAFDAAWTAHAVLYRTVRMSPRIDWSEHPLYQSGIEDILDACAARVAELEGKK